MSSCYFFFNFIKFGADTLTLPGRLRLLSCSFSKLYLIKSLSLGVVSLSRLKISRAVLIAKKIIQILSKNFLKLYIKFNKYLGLFL